MGTSVSPCLTLSIVEVSWHGDNGVLDLAAKVSLGTGAYIRSLLSSISAVLVTSP